MMWSLPTEVTVDGVVYHITNKCDYRVVLDVICALKDEELEPEQRAICALIIFYEELTRNNIFHCPHILKLQKEMYLIMNNGKEETAQDINKPRVMDWEHDFSLIAPPVSRVLGYDVRTLDRFTHWYSFLGAYMEIGECTFNTVVSIRTKRAKGKKLDKWEMDFIKEHRDLVELPQKITAEEFEALNSEW